MGLCFLSKSSIVTFIMLKSTSIKFGVLRKKGAIVLCREVWKNKDAHDSKMNCVG